MYLLMQASMTDVLFPVKAEMPKVYYLYKYLSIILAMLSLIFEFKYWHRFQIMCISVSL